MQNDSFTSIDTEPQKEYRVGTVNKNLFFKITKTCPCNRQQIFHGCKKDNFQMKNCDVFLIFAQNIDCDC